MTGVSGLTAKQLDIVKNGAVLTGNTKDEEVRKRLNRLDKNQVFYYPKGVGGGDDKWHVDVRVAEGIIKYLGNGIRYDASLSQVAETSIRYDCTDERFRDLAITYKINDNTDWNLIHVTKPGTNEKDSSKSNNQLMCPESGCGIKLTTEMGSGPRRLRRKPGEKECHKCGKFNAPRRSRPADPPPEELKHVYDDGVIPRYVETVREPEAEYIRPRAWTSSQPSWAEPPRKQPPLEPSVAPPEPTPDPTAEKQESDPEEPKVASAPVPDQHRPLQNLGPLSKSKPRDHPRVNEKALVLGAVGIFLFALILVLLWLL